jgi:hypothetical protein
MTFRSLSAALFALAPAGLALAGAESEKSAVEGLTLGDHWFGPKLSTADLKGRVVLVEFWGLK